jgi:hypothetical protein
MKCNILKKYAAQLIAAAVLVSTAAVPVAAAVTEEPMVAVQSSGTTPYVDISGLKMYSGVWSYSDYGSCTTKKAVVTITGVTCPSGVSDTSMYVATFSNTEIRLSDVSTASNGGICKIDPACNYPTQSIKAGFKKNNFNGIITVKGKFYYCGL